MPSLPSGTVTFLFTDIEGSTKLWEEHPEAMRSALARRAGSGTEGRASGGVFCGAVGLPCGDWPPRRTPSPQGASEGPWPQGGKGIDARKPQQRRRNSSVPHELPDTSL